jgi:hypothetical protein
MKLNKMGRNYLPLQLIPYQLNPEAELGLTLTESLPIITSEEGFNQCRKLFLLECDEFLKLLLN